MLTIQDEHGVARVGGPRVTLTTVITAYMLGSTPEQIIDDCPTLKLDDVYATIMFYLHHQEEVENYHEEQNLSAEQLRITMEQNHSEIFRLQRRLRQLKYRC